jgi:hypothetical protein
VGKMDNYTDMPITFQMALAHNKEAFRSFLKMDEKAQGLIIEESKKQKNIREMHFFVNSIAKGVEKVKKV